MSGELIAVYSVVVGLVLGVAAGIAAGERRDAAALERRGQRDAAAETRLCARRSAITALLAPVWPLLLVGLLLYVGWLIVSTVALALAGR